MGRAEVEREAVELLKLAGRHQAPVVLRAAGTNLLSQAISDSVLIVLGDNLNGSDIRQEGISASRTSENGLSQHGGIDCHGLIYLLERISSAKGYA